jgi:hypothetical protein
VSDEARAAEREAIVDHIFQVCRVAALAVVIRSNLEVARDAHHLAANLFAGVRERDAVFL